jgi:hypothetical protein
MSINIFKGSRRIAAVAAMCWVAGWVVGLFMTPATGSMTYYYSWPNEPPQLVDSDACSPDDASSFSRKYIGSGSIYLTLCFKGRPDGSETLVAYGVHKRSLSAVGNTDQLLVREMVELHPARRHEVERAIQQASSSKDAGDLKAARTLADRYEQDSNAVTYVAAKKFSPEINRYITATSNAFEIPEKDISLAKERIWEARKEIVPMYGGIMVGGLVVGYVFMFAIGWSLRGFVGIPMGKDSKE